MRYQNWDVLLFPELSKIPLQEFKTSCSVIQDPGSWRHTTIICLSRYFLENWMMALTKGIECHTLQTNPLLLPTVTSFIPGLLTGAAFRASIHCWQNPVVSRYIQNLKKPSDNIIFEARLFIDGRMAG
jgi:hypothetical protein